MFVTKEDAAKAALAKGLLAAGHKPQAIADWMRVKKRKIIDIRAGRTYADVRARGRRRLPNIERDPPQPWDPKKMRRTVSAPVEAEPPLTAPPPTRHIEVAGRTLEEAGKALVVAGTALIKAARLLAPPQRENTRVDSVNGKLVPHPGANGGAAAG